MSPKRDIQEWMSGATSANDISNPATQNGDGEVASHPLVLSQVGDEDEEGEEVDLDALGVTDTPITRKKKKSKKKKPKSKRGIGAPTGFEEYYVDAPMTPEDHAENEKIYDSELPFVDRILTSIHRFERTRRLEALRRDIFYKYLAYGSVDVSENMFQGLDTKSIQTQEMDKGQLAAALSRTSISAGKRDLVDSLYAVDFTGCVSAFMSRRASELFPTDTKDDVKVVTTTLERFMDYLLQHNVCPEYSPDVLRARETCRRATNELWSVSEAQRWLPGDFNMACSTLFSGQYSRDYDGITNWGPGIEGQPDFIGFTQETANQIVSFGISGAAEEEVYLDFMEKVKAKTLDVVEKRERVGFEITRIEPPSEECRTLYKTHSQNFRPVGRVYAKGWSNPDAPPEDLTPEEREELARKQVAAEREWSGSHNPPDPSDEKAETYVFLIEEIIQTHLFVGMKVEATLHRLNCGDRSNRSLWFFDELLKCFASFDLFLPNEMLVGWKEPRSLPGALDYVGEEIDGVEGGGDSDAAEGVVEVGGQTEGGVNKH